MNVNFPHHRYQKKRIHTYMNNKGTYKSCSSFAYTARAFSRSRLMPTFSSVSFCIIDSFCGTRIIELPSQRQWISSRNSSVEFQHLHTGFEWVSTVWSCVWPGKLPLIASSSSILWLPSSGSTELDRIIAAGETMSISVTMCDGRENESLSSRGTARTNRANPSRRTKTLQTSTASTNFCRCRALHTLIIVERLSQRKNPFFTTPGTSGLHSSRLNRRERIPYGFIFSLRSGCCWHSYHRNSSFHPLHLQGSICTRMDWSQVDALHSRCFICKCFVPMVQCFNFVPHYLGK